MQRLINRAISGNSRARDLLDMYDQEIVPAVKTVTPQTLRADFKYAGTQFFAAMQLQLKSLERMVKKLLVHLFWIDKHHFQSSALTGDATLIEEDDVLEEMSLLCTDLPLTRQMRRRMPTVGHNCSVIYL